MIIKFKKIFLYLLLILGIFVSLKFFINIINKSNNNEILKPKYYLIKNKIYKKYNNNSKSNSSLEESSSIYPYVDKNQVIVKNNLFKVTFNKEEAKIIKIELFNYYKHNNFVNLNSLIDKINYVDSKKTEIIQEKFYSGPVSFLLKVSKKIKDKMILTFESQRNNIAFSKNFIFKQDSYLIDINYKITNYSDRKINGFLSLKLFSKDIINKNLFTEFVGPIIYTNKNKLQRLKFEKDGQKFITKVKSGWISYIKDNFVNIIMIPQKIERFIIIIQKKEIYHSIEEIVNLGPMLSGDSLTIKVKFYAGPQEYSILSQIDPYLSLIKNYGHFNKISRFVFFIIRSLQGFCNNWGSSVIFMTFFLKITFFYLSAKNYKNSLMIKNIKDKILNYKILKLYKSKKINPWINFFFIIIQLPFFLSLYSIISKTLEIKNSSWFWINNFSKSDNYHILAIFILVILICKNKIFLLKKKFEKIILFLPTLYFSLFYFFPSNLVIYWFVNYIYSEFQNKIFLKKYEIKKYLYF